MRAWGGCFVTIGAGMLQFVSVEGERKHIFLDGWEVSESVPAGAVILWTHASPSAGNLPRAITLPGVAPLIDTG